MHRERPELSRATVLAAAVRLADAEGLERLSMRRLGQALGVEAMSLYHHVEDKEDLLDGMVEEALAEVELPRPGEPWRPGMVRRARSTLAMFRRHPWAVQLVDSRTRPGPVTLAHHDAVLRCLREDGFPLALAAHAFSAIDSYLHGFALQHAKLPFEGSEELEALVGEIQRGMPADAYPFLHELMRDHVLQPGYDFDDEFEYGLELLLDGLERALGLTRS